MKKPPNNEWYSLRSVLGNCNWAMFFALLGGREAGKSYAVMEFFVDQFVNRGRPFFWLRLSEPSAKKMLANDAEKLVDPDIRRKFNLDLVTRNSGVYQVLKRDKKTGKVREMRLMCRVLALSTFYNDKGVAMFDKDFLDDPNMWYNCCLDEMNREQSERRNFDITYNFVNQMENLFRSTKSRIRIFLIGNTLEEASDIMSAFNFIPEDFGRYYVRKKRLLVDYMPPTDKYLQRRKGTIADILMGGASTFTNKVETDSTLVYKGKLMKPTAVIRFFKNEAYTLWDGKVITKYRNENVHNIAMRPYLDQVFNAKERDAVFQTFDARGYRFRDLITFKQFQKSLEMLKPRS